MHVWASIFADVAVPVLDDSRRITNRVLADAGPGVALRGRFFDRNIALRADFPVYVRALADSDRELDFRLRLSARDLF
jgi:hypothetical protein